MWKLWLIKVLPFMDRWVEAGVAGCCGVCPTCLTASATGMTLTVIGAKPTTEGETPEDSAP